MNCDRASTAHDLPPLSCYPPGSRPPEDLMLETKIKLSHVREVPKALQGIPSRLFDLTIEIIWCTLVSTC